jgi:sugar lactone lactonase YvrE
MSHCFRPVVSACMASQQALDDQEPPRYTARHSSPELMKTSVLSPCAARPNWASNHVGSDQLCFSPDEKKLYIVDTGATDGPQYPAHVCVFDVNGGKLPNGKVFADFRPGFTDGIRCDTDGDLWCAWGWAARIPTAFASMHRTATRSA